MKVEKQYVSKLNDEQYSFVIKYLSEDDRFIAETMHIASGVEYGWEKLTQAQAYQYLRTRGESKDSANSIIESAYNDGLTCAQRYDASLPEQYRAGAKMSEMAAKKGTIYYTLCN